MTKKIISMLLIITTLLSLFSVITTSSTYESNNFTYISIPYEVDYTKNITVKARYKDTKEPITLSHTYNDRLYAYIPYENKEREIEAFETSEISFSDNKNNDYKFHMIEELSRTSLIIGNENKEARPYDNITRAEATALVMRMLGIKEDFSLDIPFSDVKKDDWFYGVVASSYKNKMILGKDATSFAPLDNITREEIMVILDRAVTFSKMGYPYDDNMNVTDFNLVSDWAKGAYQRLGNYASTDVDNTEPENPKRVINPTSYATRYDVAYTIYNIVNFCVIFPSEEAVQFGFSEKLPVIDGSTSTYPFTDAVYRKLFYNGTQHPQKPQKHSKSHQSYERLINGEIDMMFASVYPASDILEYAKEKNVELELIPIAYDAMIFFTNKDNTIEGLTKEQISEIYVNNKYSNWNELGGPDALLIPYCRNNDSGSHAQMEKHFLGGREIHEKIRQETTSETMSNVLTDVMAARKDNPLSYGLGYSIYYYFNNMDLFYNTKTELKLLSIDGVYPTDETIANGSYPLSNNTYIVIRKDTIKDAPARKMAEFMLTKKGQECVEEAGFGKLMINEKSFNDKLTEIYDKENKNYALSPLSIKLALGLLLNGAEGETKNEILSALNISNVNEINNLSKEISEKFSKTDLLTLKVANSVWLNEDKTTQNFSKLYTDTIKEYYNADVFKTDDKNAVTKVNSWVNDKTSGKIPELINNSDFWAMIVNAVYFKGLWQDDFFEGATKKDEFTNFDNTKSQIDFLRKTAWITHGKTDKIEVIELPFMDRIANFDDNGNYTGTSDFDLDISMFFAMANSQVEIEKELNTLINNNGLSGQYTDLYLPKFKIEYETKLNDTLKNLGMDKAFKETAEFHNMFDKGNMWITDVIHKTYLNVDEKGCEAAAVTGIAMAGSALPPEPVTLKFNKPFYFLIRDNSNGEILFMGKFVSGK